MIISEENACFFKMYYKHRSRNLEEKVEILSTAHSFFFHMSYYITKGTRSISAYCKAVIDNESE